MENVLAKRVSIWYRRRRRRCCCYKSILAIIIFIITYSLRSETFIGQGCKYSSSLSHYLILQLPFFRSASCRIRKEDTFRLLSWCLWYLRIFEDKIYMKFLEKKKKRATFLSKIYRWRLFLIYNLIWITLIRVSENCWSHHPFSLHSISKFGLPSGHIRHRFFSIHEPNSLFIDNKILNGNADSTIFSFVFSFQIHSNIRYFTFSVSICGTQWEKRTESSDEKLICFLCDVPTHGAAVSLLRDLNCFFLLLLLLQSKHKQQKENKIKVFFLRFPREKSTETGDKMTNKGEDSNTTTDDNISLNEVNWLNLDLCTLFSSYIFVTFR